MPFLGLVDYCHCALFYLLICCCRNELMISWGGEKKSAVELLFEFLKVVYRYRHCDKNCQSNRSIEHFGVSLVTGGCNCISVCFISIVFGMYS